LVCFPRFPARLFIWTGCYYRQSLIDVIQLVKTKIEPDFLELMKQIAEIQEIAYADDKDRDIVKILRFHNVTFMHGQYKDVL